MCTIWDDLVHVCPTRSTSHSKQVTFRQGNDGRHHCRKLSPGPFGTSSSNSSRSGPLKGWELGSAICVSLCQLICLADCVSALACSAANDSYIISYTDYIIILVERCWKLNAAKSSSSIFVFRTRWCWQSYRTFREKHTHNNLRFRVWDLMYHCFMLHHIGCHPMFCLLWMFVHWHKMYITHHNTRYPGTRFWTCGLQDEVGAAAAFLRQRYPWLGDDRKSSAGSHEVALG
jgi:hypothetical protein